MYKCHKLHGFVSLHLTGDRGRHWRLCTTVLAVKKTGQDEVERDFRCEFDVTPIRLWTGEENLMKIYYERPCGRENEERAWLLLQWILDFLFVAIYLITK